MPHLSPMNWILALLMFWTMLLSLSTKSWWNYLSVMPFKINYKPYTSYKSSNLWKWN